MSLETVEEDLNYYKPVIKKYSCLRKHIYIQTIPENFNTKFSKYYNSWLVMFLREICIL